MKVIKHEEYKYFFREEDVVKVKEALGYDGSLKALAIELGISYKSLWEKMKPTDTHYFDHLEILKIEKYLNIDLSRD